jgi:hypothetical protein
LRIIKCQFKILKAGRKRGRQFFVMVLLDSSSKGKSRRRLFYGGADSVLMRSSSFGMIFDDEVVGKILSETVMGLIG